MSQRPPAGAHVVTDQELMLWVDGELDARRSAEVGLHVQGDPRARSIVAALRLSASLIESDALRHAGSSGADRIVGSVMDSIEAEAALGVRGRAKQAPVWRLRTASAAGVALAMAAAWAMFFRAPTPGSPVAQIASSAPSGLIGGADVDGDSKTASIEVVDFGARPGTIFYVPSEGESAMAVVWLTDDDSSPTSGDPQ
jgi:anti-sigma factor RsiW